MTTKDDKKTGIEFRNTGLGRFFSQYSAQLIFLIVIFVFMSFASRSFLTIQNLLNVSRQVSINMITACAMTMIMIVGGFDLSVGSVMAMAGMVSTYMSQAGVPFGICLIAGIATGALTGFVNGYIISNTKLPPFIVTYSTQNILRGMVYVISGAATVRLTSEAYLGFGGGSLGIIPLPVIYMVVMIIVSDLILRRTRYGRKMFAIGGNSKAAQYSGINIKNIRVSVYVMLGCAAAFAGMVLTSRNSSMQPSLGAEGAMDAIAAVVLGGTSMAGGRGGIPGTIIGAFIIGFINNGLNMLRMDSFYQYIAKGLIVLVAVYLDDRKNARIEKGK